MLLMYFRTLVTLILILSTTLSVHISYHHMACTRLHSSSSWFEAVQVPIESVDEKRLYLPIKPLREVTWGSIADSRLLACVHDRKYTGLDLPHIDRDLIATFIHGCFYMRTWAYPQWHKWKQDISVVITAQLTASMQSMKSEVVMIASNKQQFSFL